MYSWVLWFHIVSLISWFAVLFYLPSLFVYHVENMENRGFVEVVKIQEYKLYKYIGIPSMYATILSGASLVYLGGWADPWLYLKVMLVVVLVWYFLTLERYRADFAEDLCDHNGKFFRIYNEVPTILMLIIVALVILKPF